MSARIFQLERQAPSGAGAVSKEALEHAKDMVRGHYPNHREYVVARALLDAATEDRATDSPMNAGRT